MIGKRKILLKGRNVTTPILMLQMIVILGAIVLLKTLDWDSSFRLWTDGSVYFTIADLLLLGFMFIWLAWSTYSYDIGENYIKKKYYWQFRASEKYENINITGVMKYPWGWFAHRIRIDFKHKEQSFREVFDLQDKDINELKQFCQTKQIPYEE